MAAKYIFKIKNTFYGIPFNLKSYTCTYFTSILTPHYQVFPFSSALNRFPCTLCISEVWFLFFFNFQRKSLEQELSQGSVLALPIAILLGVAIYNYQKVKLTLPLHRVQFSYNLKIHQMKFLKLLQLVHTLHLLWLWIGLLHLFLVSCAFAIP